MAFVGDGQYCHTKQDNRRRHDQCHERDQFVKCGFDETAVQTLSIGLTRAIVRESSLIGTVYMFPDLMLIKMFCNVIACRLSHTLTHIGIQSKRDHAVRKSFHLFGFYNKSCFLMAYDLIAAIDIGNDTRYLKTGGL